MRKPSWMRREGEREGGGRGEREKALPPLPPSPLPHGPHDDLQGTPRGLASGPLEIFQRDVAPVPVVDEAGRIDSLSMDAQEGGRQSRAWGGEKFCLGTTGRQFFILLSW